MISYNHVKRVLDKKQKSILAKKGVVATGIAYKIINGERTQELALVCSVDKKKPLSEIRKQDLIPSAVKGIPTDVVEVGIIKAFHTERYRPAPGGVSIGHVDITCGTLGCLVEKNGEQYILSNNHVLALSNDADIGDDVLQPGSHDGGTNPSDCIAKLSDFVKLNFTGGSSDCKISKVFTAVVNSVLSVIGSKTNIQSVKQTETNLVDAAIAKPLKDEYVTDEIKGLGKIIGIKPAALGMKIKKSGRTTGLTTGEIIQMNVTTNVQYGDGKTATFTDQFMAGPMSAGGDSGSAILSEDNHLVGLLYAGSEQVTLCNKIENVFKLLHIDSI
jgi:hypothetical protein